MPITYTVPDSITKKDRLQIERAVEIALRNANIVQEYPDMRDEYGMENALEKLAKKYKISRGMVTHVLYRYNKM